MHVPAASALLPLVKGVMNRSALSWNLVLGFIFTTCTEQMTPCRNAPELLQLRYSLVVAFVINTRLAVD